MNNQDVLLLSECQQLLLQATTFPLVAYINGVDSLGGLLQNHDIQDKPVVALFYRQIEKLCELSLLVNSDKESNKYLKPSVDDRCLILTYWLNENCLIENLSALGEALLDNNEGLWETIANSRAVAHKSPESLSLILVDDLLDSRICSLAVQDYFIVVKISGEKISFSPKYSRNEKALFSGLQEQLLANQPVMKWLMTGWPEGSHSVRFSARQVFSVKQSEGIAKLLSEQLLNTNTRQLINYNLQNLRTDYHSVNSGIQFSHDFSAKIHTPLKLNQCISRFNKDGGSRSITAEATVQRLMPLVSPVTGIINHLIEVESNFDNPVKIYRTGYFQTPNKSNSLLFNQNSFVQICLGKGVSPEQSKASALSEAIERYCALYQDDVPLYKNTQSALTEKGERSVSYHDLVPYSNQQYQNFGDRSGAESQRKQASTPYQDESIHWLPTWSLSGEERVYAPLSQCFSNIPFDDDQFGRWHSNGCAAGNTLEEAILQGLFELIERDAAGIWWYNRITRPLFDLSLMDQGNLEKLKETLSPTHSNDVPSHDFWVLDLTNDLGVPVMAAIGKDTQTGGWVMGFGCHLIPAMAAQRALTELCQLIPIRNQNSAPFDFDAIEAGSYLYGDSSEKAAPPMLSSSGDIKDDILAIVGHLKDLGFETLVLDYSRAHIPLHTAKVFVPGLCHIWPQLGNERLYEVPVSLGWLSHHNTELSINPLALYI